MNYTIYNNSTQNSKKTIIITTYKAIHLSILLVYASPKRRFFY